jgi:hypothetical protein
MSVLPLYGEDMKKIYENLIQIERRSGDLKTTIRNNCPFGGFLANTINVDYIKQLQNIIELVDEICYILAYDKKTKSSMYI